MPHSIYQYSVKNNTDKVVELANYKNKVLLVVNTASACGFTPQYKGLQKLHDEYQTQGLEILAFPCNQFKQQEKGSDSEIQNFCDLQFNIKFQLFSKIDVNGDNEIPLYTYLKQQAPGILGSKAIKWNFTKFLVSREGVVLKRYAPSTKPQSITEDIKRELAK